MMLFMSGLPGMAAGTSRLTISRAMDEFPSGKWKLNEPSLKRAQT